MMTLFSLVLSVHLRETVTENTRPNDTCRSIFRRARTGQKVRGTWGDLSHSPAVALELT